MKKSKVNLTEVTECLSKHIYDAAKHGLSRANTNGALAGKFESKFQAGFVGRFRDNQADFPDDLGSISLDEHRVETDDEARTGADICITWTHPQDTSQTFTLFLQLKILYKDYDHYYNAIHLKKAPVDRPNKDSTWEGLKKGYYDIQYKSKRQGPYYGEYQVIRMQKTVEKLQATNGFRRVAAGFLLIPSPGKTSSGTFAQDVSLVPVQFIQETVHPQGIVPLSDSDVDDFTASQLDETLSDQVQLIKESKQSGRFTIWLETFISPDFYEDDSSVSDDYAFYEPESDQDDEPQNRDEVDDEDDDDDEPVYSEEE